MRTLRRLLIWLCLLSTTYGSLFGGTVDSSAVIRPSAPSAIPTQGQRVIQDLSRSIEDWELADFVLVATIDGSLHARDRQTGIELWSLAGDGPLVSVSSRLDSEVTGEEPTDDDSNIRESDITWIVEPLGDGVLYYFTEATSLQQLPVSIRQLVLESPFAIHGDDKIYTGSRQTTLYSISAATGSIVKIYGERGGLGQPECRPKRPGLFEDDIDYVEDDEEYYSSSSGTFMIGRTDYHLEIHGKNETIWNVTYSTWGPNNMDGDLMSQQLRSPDNLYVTPVHNSSILALSTDSKSKPARWVGSVPSMVVSVFDVFRSTDSSKSDHLTLLPQPRYASPRPVDGKLDAMGTYVERTSSGQWFALSGKYFPSLVNSAPRARWSTHKNKFRSKQELLDSLVGVHPHTLRDYEDVFDTNYIPGIAGPAPRLGIDAPPSSAIGFHPQPNVALDYYGSDSGKNRVEGVRYHRGNQVSQPSPLPVAPPAPETTNVQTTGPLIPTWYSIITRLIENLMTFAIIVGGTLLAARFGWFPQLTELMDIVISRRRSELIVGPNGDVASAVPDVAKQYSNDTAKPEENAEVKPDLKVDTTPVTARENEAQTEYDKESPLSPEQEKKIEIVEPEEVKNKTDKPKKRKRGSRGGKKNAAKLERQKQLQQQQQGQDNEGDEGENTGFSDGGLDDADDDFANAPFTVGTEVLGVGSHGTTVLKGEFQGRPVAIKKMLVSFCDVTSQEISLLQESDDHANVIRYFCNHRTKNFLFIALELCPGSLEELVEKPWKFQEIIDNLNPKHVLYQIANGIEHLHNLKIVHRDIKPQNILVAPPRSYYTKGKNNQNEVAVRPVRMVISDFGLCKKLETEQSSFRATTAHKAGTIGWTAPEILYLRRQREREMHIDQSPMSSSDGNGAVVTSSSSVPDSDLLMGMDVERRLTRAVDVFSLGCVFYYFLTHGKHPFGDSSIREKNIEANKYSLDELGAPDEPDSVEAHDLISKMISFDPRKRPEASEVILHPYFWTPQKKLDFLLKVSDWVESEGRERFPEYIDEIEAHAPEVVGEDWHDALDKLLCENLLQYRKYHGDRIVDLLRVMRNKSHHYNELPSALQNIMPYPEGFLVYFTRRFPLLLITIYYFAKNRLRDQMAIKPFFEPEQHI
uniref:non-specific serine/threonine protein kinase n=1 Tax=Blastobotrys adeninivorans TaxID=409370 RepID=A0A060T7Y2_BLAAD